MDFFSGLLAGYCVGAVLFAFWNLFGPQAKNDSELGYRLVAFALGVGASFYLLRHGAAGNLDVLAALVICVWLSFASHQSGRKPVCC